MEQIRREVTAKEKFFEEMLKIEKEKLEVLKSIAKPTASN